MPSQFPHQWPLARRPRGSSASANLVIPRFFGGWFLPRPATRDCGKRMTAAWPSGVWSSGIVQTITLDLIGEADARQAEFVRRPTLIPAMAPQRRGDNLLFKGLDHIFERFAVTGNRNRAIQRRLHLVENARKMARRDVAALFGDRHHSADFRFQFAHIARKVIRLKLGQRLHRDADDAAPDDA